jgi:hypothetical protein
MLTGIKVKSLVKLTRISRNTGLIFGLPQVLTAYCTMGTGLFPGVKRPGCGTDHPPPYKRRGHERVGLYIYSPSGPQWLVIGRTFTFTLPGAYNKWAIPSSIRYKISFTEVLKLVSIIRERIASNRQILAPKQRTSQWKDCYSQNTETLLIISNQLWNLEIR